VDPKRQGLLYLGTERGLYYSTDDGGHWQALKLNLPSVAVSDLVVKGGDLVVGTNGRSIWILDDLAPLRELAPGITTQDVHLFSIRPIIRWRQAGSLDEGPRAGTFSNPANGVVFHYWLKAKPKGDVTLEILDQKGATVQTLTSKEEPKETKSQDEG